MQNLLLLQAQQNQPLPHLQPISLPQLLKEPRKGGSRQLR